MSYPVEINNLRYRPVPENWIRAGRDDRSPDGPQLLAVSVAILRNRLKIRYAHPRYESVAEVYYPTIETDAGLLPDSSTFDNSWPRSIGASDLDPVDVVRDEEREHLADLWSDHIGSVLDDPDRFRERDEDLIADGGYNAPDRSGPAKPAECRHCGHTPRNDDGTFTSGGGWINDLSVLDDGGRLVNVERLICPVCDSIVAREETSSWSDLR
jgi:hypothetical protein